MRKTKSKKQEQLGKAISRSRFGAKAPDARTQSMHTTDINEKAEKSKGLMSVTQLGDFQSFMEHAEVSDRDFTAEKQNAILITAEQQKEQRVMLMRDEPSELILERWNDITIPRRPIWDENTTPEQLDENEKDSFLQWRRDLAKMEEEKKLLLTPFEKNLQVWRQLWRVVERSDVIIQIVDGRNPLLFRCPDLEKYVKEVNPNKKNFLLVNKADLLSKPQRREWSKYFKSQGIDFLFFSANFEKVKLEQKTLERQKLLERMSANPSSEFDISRAIAKEMTLEEKMESNGGKDEEHQDEDELEEEEQDEDTEEVNEERLEKDELDESVLQDDTQSVTEEVINKKKDSTHVYNREELIDFLINFKDATKLDDDGNPAKVVIGLVGYPNVGKSSTINVLIGEKKVSVSATPGKTKHFQTLNLDDMTLCDCPGLVFPTFMTTKAEMIVNGLLPIDHMREHVGPVSLVCHRIPRRVLEAVYGVTFPKIRDDEANRDPTAEELLQAYAVIRGFMVDHGTPYQSKAARLVLKDYVNGLLCYCHPPPNIDAKKFNETTKFTNKKLSARRQEQSENTQTATSTNGESTEDAIKRSKRYKRAHRKHDEPTIKQGDGSEEYRGLMNSHIGGGAAHIKSKGGDAAFTRRKNLHTTVPVTALKQMKQISTS